MPLTKLLCEGVAKGVDVVVLGALLSADRILIAPFGSKTGLGAAAAALRDEKISVSVIRDRDFDFEPQAGEAPRTYTWGGKNVGWFWSRHEIENYLVDPALVVPALSDGVGFEPTAYAPLLLEAAAFDLSAALLWFSGKDLLSALRPPAEAVWWTSPAALRNDVRDWIHRHPDKVLAVVPEWARLRELVLSAQ
jgi:hypothetical protein